MKRIIRLYRSLKRKNYLKNRERKQNLELRRNRVVLFGVNDNWHDLLKYCIDTKINVAYFVDDKPGIDSLEYKDDSGQVNTYPVLKTEALRGESRKNLKIVITSDFPKYKSDEEMLIEMGFEECIFQTKIVCCNNMLNHIIFHGEVIGFCCYSSSAFNSNMPAFPYLSTSDETITKFLENRKLIIEELNNNALGMTIAEPCVNCKKLTDRNHLFGINKIKSINISCYPSICQAKCVYCGVPNNTSYSYENSKESRYPKMIADMLCQLKTNDLIADKCLFIVAPAEITIMPHKDFLLDTIARHRAIFLTNGFLFDEKIADSMEENNSEIKVSIDSGTRETFNLIKGLDFYEKVSENLQRYRQHGFIDLKYIVIAGVNDGEKDLNGLMELVDELKLDTVKLSFDYNMPLRSSFYPIALLVKKLQERGKDFSFYPFYTKEQILKFIDMYYKDEYIPNYNKKAEYYSEIFEHEYRSDYYSYRKLVYRIELKNLLMQFNTRTRFCISNDSRNEGIISLLNELQLSFSLNEAPIGKEEYSRLYNHVDVFITSNENESRGLQTLVDIGGDSNSILNIEKYMYSFEPERVFLDNNIPNKHLLKKMNHLK